MFSCNYFSTVYPIYSAYSLYRLPLFGSFINHGRLSLICSCTPVFCISYSICSGCIGSEACFYTFFSAKHLRGLYILGGILGGLLYMVAYNVFPLFNQEVAVSTLVGASASVLAIVAATAYREPNYRVQLFLFGAIRLKYLALVVIGIDVLSITSSNAGGHIAHLGGALAGLWFAASLSKGADLTAWINWLLDAFISLFQKKTWKHKPKMKVHYGGGTTSREKDYDYNAHKKAQSDEIDRILDKLKKSGYDSLTTEEKKSLFDASKR